MGRALLQNELPLDAQQLREAPLLMTTLRPLNGSVDGLQRLCDFTGVPHRGGKFTQQPKVTRQRPDLRSFREYRSQCVQSSGGVAALDERHALETLAPRAPQAECVC